MPAGSPYRVVLPSREQRDGSCCRPLRATRTTRSRKRASSRASTCSMERVDTLAATVATTASAMAKRDGEIASLRRELQTRDDALQATGGAGSGRFAEPRDDGEAPRARGRRRRHDERALQGGSSKQLEELTAKVGLLGQRLETVSTTVSTTAAGLAAREGELATIRKRLESAPPPDRRTARRSGAEAAAGRPLGGSGEHEAPHRCAGRRAGRPEDTGRRSVLPSRIALPRSSARCSPPLRTQVEALERTQDRRDRRAARRAPRRDRRRARAALRAHRRARRARRVGRLEPRRQGARARRTPPPLHRVERTHRGRRRRHPRGAVGASRTWDPPPSRSSPRRGRAASESATLARRASTLEAAPTSSQPPNRRRSIERVATVATEVARAKTLWPVALRSLEARLDDAVSHADRDEPESPSDDGQRRADAHDDPSDDLLAGLRDSLQAMETVAAEMASSLATRSEPSSTTDGRRRTTADEPTVTVAVAGGARSSRYAGEP